MKCSAKSVKKLKYQDGNDELYQIGKDMAMQVAAMNPISVKREDVLKETVDKEIEIYKALAKKEGKPEQMLEKIAMGRLNKFYQENVLLEQAFIKDNSKTVADLLKEFNAKHSSNTKVVKFDRFHLGDEIK
jgi:elongation factor Ts